uniref:Uncharacterized protein n=1 Tax=Cyanothece sp. (strain PCC 7425 / ATCC 29141) TaxID=395961 RepID=B8HYH1_CYAP4
MDKNTFENIYNQIYDEIYPQAKTIKRGLLYKTIQIIFNEEESKTQNNTLVLCNSIGIKSSDNREHDYKTLEGLVEVIENEHPFIRDWKKLRPIADNISRMTNKPEEEKEMQEIKWIIVGACVLVGLYFCAQYIKKIQSRKSELKLAEQENKSPSYPSIPADLCLVVPGKIACDFRAGSSLSVKDVTYLIDNTSYFLCGRLEEIDPIEKKLTLADEYVSPDSEQKVYIRINISSNAQDLVNKKTIYILKRDLPTMASFTLKKIACLRSLRGFEAFNRI